MSSAIFLIAGNRLPWATLQARLAAWSTGAAVSVALAALGALGALAALAAFAAPTHAQASAALQKQAPAPTTEPAIPYTVRAGDKLITLGAQLLRQPADWPAVARFNLLSNADRLRLGQLLNVPVRLLKPLPAEAKGIKATGDGRQKAALAPVQASSVLPDGTRLRTGANSSVVVELADDSRVTLLTNSLAELAVSRGYAMLSDSNSNSNSNSNSTSATSPVTWFSTLIRLVQGTLDAVAAKTALRATPQQIETPTSPVGVRGTQFRVDFDDLATQSARTELLEGSVRADDTLQASGAQLGQGKGALLNPAVKAIKVVDLLPAPDLLGAPENTAADAAPLAEASARRPGCDHARSRPLGTGRAADAAPGRGAGRRRQGRAADQPIRAADRLGLGRRAAAVGTALIWR